MSDEKKDVPAEQSEDEVHANRHWVELHHNAIDELGETVCLVSVFSRIFTPRNAFIHEIEIEDECDYEFDTRRKKVVIETGVISIKHSEKNLGKYQDECLIVRGNLFTIESVTDRGGQIVELSIRSVRIEDRL